MADNNNEEDTLSVLPTFNIVSIFPELREKSEEKKIKRSVVFSSLASKKNMWENRVTSFKEKQSVNVFSGRFDQAKTEKIDPKLYGIAPEGSRTEERANEASQWVENEISKLVSVIKDIGVMDAEEDGITVTFGVLFDAYTDISDTLVGILMRCKKRNILKYQGQMLYQGASAKVKITLLTSAAAAQPLNDMSVC